MPKCRGGSQWMHVDIYYAAFIYFLNLFVLTLGICLSFMVNVDRCVFASAWSFVTLCIYLGYSTIMLAISERPVRN